jgi:7,8-dihydropterin-6-yl-methyl-4-(beta-D-ribofuranosyl)aminobenzene 5'-phosphate synthase
MNSIHIREADRAEVTILVDNYVDMLMLPSTAIDKRPQTPPGKPLLAEHGLSCLIRVFDGTEEHCVLMDAGVSPVCISHNASMLNIDLKVVESFVLSHGHFDHFTGLLEFLKLSGRKIPLELHPDAFLERRLNPPGRTPVVLPRLDEPSLIKGGALIEKSTTPSVIASGLLAMTGEIARTNSFEKGFPWAEVKINGKWIVDPFHDDQGLIIKLHDKGIVVISGCAHAGIINTVEYARKISGSDKVHAVLGGFHLTGPLFEPIIEPTVQEMKRINPDYVIPMHCTGWKAINRFAEEIPGKFLLNTVGTTYVF